MKHYTQDTLNTLSLKSVTEINNSYCEKLGTKPTKRFATKTIAIKKALLNQEKFQAEEAQKAAEKLANMEITDKEYQLIVDIAEDEMNSISEPTAAADISTYVFSPVNTHSKAGVFSSLLQKGLAHETKLTSDDVCGLTDTGFDIYLKAKIKGYKLSSATVTKKTSADINPKQATERATRKQSTVTSTYKRPKPGTKTGRVWEIADALQTRSEVMKKAAEEGINLYTASRQFHLWSHRED